MRKIKGMMDMLTIFWVLFFSIDALANAIILTMTNVEWTNLSPTRKWVLAAMVIKTWSGAMIALFTKAYTRAEKGAPIIADEQDNTRSFTKSDVGTPQQLGKP